MILTRTPLRCSLLGGGSDYPAHYVAHGGSVLGLAIDKYVYVGVKRVPPGQLMAHPQTKDPVPIRFRIQYSRVDDCLTVDDIHHPAVRAAIKYLGMENDRIEFTTFADLPGRSGLGGSSAFVVGCLHALLRLKDPRRAVTPMDLAREAIAFEQFYMREAVGSQDQLFAALGGMRYIKFGPESHAHALRVSWVRIERLTECLVLAYTGLMRDAQPLAAAQIAEAPTNAAALQALSHLADDGFAWMLSERPLFRIGELLDESWRHKRKFAGVDNPQIDDLYARGLKLGATGGKLLGAGGGGFLMFYVPEHAREAFESRIGAPLVRFGMAQRGSEVIINEP